MTRYKVILLPGAEARLGAIKEYLAEQSSPATAGRFVAGLVDRALRLNSFPFRGTPRNDLMQGLRTVTIAYVVKGDEVAVTDFLYRGADAAGRFGG